MDPLVNSIDTALRNRAQQVVPGGMWGHMKARLLGKSYPQFFKRADGCKIWDVDGNEYVDLMCSWGPIVLGHHHTVVDQAFAAQMERGDTMNGPAEVMVELAELLVSTIAHADWAMFQKNGTDATTACLTIARAGTGRRKVLVARGSYHGAVPWCSPSVAGVTAEDRAHLLYFDYNDTRSLEQAADQARGDLAAIIVTAFRHDLGRAQELPEATFAQRARKICDNEDAALVLDDVRAGFRIDIAGSWEPLGVRPDLSAFSKAIANGYPLSAIAGNDRFREAAAQPYLTGSFWCSSASMAAALATINVLKKTDALQRMKAMGERLRSGLDRLAAKNGFKLQQTGPAQMPMIAFEDDREFKRMSVFCALALRNGAYLHPKHNLFLSAAHQPADIDHVLLAAEKAFEEMARSYGVENRQERA